jgi:hypothetical protein
MFMQAAGLRVGLLFSFCNFVCPRGLVVATKTAASINTNVVCQALESPVDSDEPDDNIWFACRTLTTL